MNHYFKVTRPNGNIHHVCLSEVNEDLLFDYLGRVKKYEPITELDFSSQIAFADKVLTIPFSAGGVAVAYSVYTKPVEEKFSRSDWIGLVFAIAFLLYVIVEVIKLLS